MGFTLSGSEWTFVHVNGFYPCADFFVITQAIFAITHDRDRESERAVQDEVPLEHFGFRIFRLFPGRQKVFLTLVGGVSLGTATSGSHELFPQPLRSTKTTTLSLRIDGIVSSSAYIEPFGPEETL